MAITSMTIRGLVDEEGDTRIVNVDASIIAFSIGSSPATIAAMSENEFFNAALDYLEAYTDIENTGDAKIDTIYN